MHSGEKIDRKTLQSSEFRESLLTDASAKASARSWHKKNAPQSVLKFIRFCPRVCYPAVCLYLGGAGAAYWGYTFYCADLLVDLGSNVSQA